VGIEVDKKAGKGGKGMIYKLDRDGKVLWKWIFQAGSYLGGGGNNPINGGILSSAAIDPERNLVFYSTSHHPRLGMGYLIALDRKTGKLKWKQKLNGFAWSSPICAGGVVFAADSTGSAFIRDAATGETLLKDAAGAPSEFINLGANVEGSPIVWHGRIYVGIRGGAEVCLGNPSP
jgi:outer membrane protein assembly factor BamB